MHRKSIWTRRRFFGLFALLWGGGILAYKFLGGGDATRGTYATGQTAAFVFATVLFLVGGYYMAKR